jgi:hypothetical protein
MPYEDQMKTENQMEFSTAMMKLPDLAEEEAVAIQGSPEGAMLVLKNRLNKDGLAGLQTALAALQVQNLKGDMQAKEQKKKATFANTRAMTSTSLGSMEALKTKATALLKGKGLDKISGLQGLVWDAPGGIAADARAGMESLKGTIGLTVLQNLKAMSGTGLGSVTEGEHKLLQNYLAALVKNQSEPSLRKNLQVIIDWADAVQERIKIEYKETYGENFTYGDGTYNLTASDSGVTRPASGGVTRPASGGVTRPASGGVTRPASDGVIDNMSKEELDAFEQQLDGE